MREASWDSGALAHGGRTASEFSAVEQYFFNGTSWVLRWLCRLISLKQWATVKCVKLTHFFRQTFFRLNLILLFKNPQQEGGKNKKKRRFPEMYFLDRHSLVVFECHIVWACMGEATLNDVECFMAPCLCVNPSPVLLWDSERRGSSTAAGSVDQGVTRSRPLLTFKGALFQNATYLPCYYRRSI